LGETLYATGAPMVKSILSGTTRMDNIRELFKPHAKTVKQIFGDADSYYQIPDYQRPYSWETEQIEQLWEDIYTAMEIDQETYFLGAIILTNPGNGYFEVVDGQQRLTTLTILLCVLRDFYLKRDNALINSIKSLVDGKYRLRLITQSHYQNKFEKEILDAVKLPSERLTKEEREDDPFVNAVLIFRDKLKSVRNIDTIRKFLEYLMNRVVLITITCSNQAFAIKLFQVLNTRGLDLTNTDLIKSHLFGNCAKDKLAQLKASWIQIETIAEEAYDDTDRMITYYGLSVLERNPRSTMSAELLDHRDFKTKDSNSIVFDMLTFSKAYKQLWSTESKLMFSFWYLPNDIYWKSILTTAIHRDYKDFLALAKQLRKLYWSYWIAGYTISKIKQTSFNLIGWVKAHKPIAFIEKEIDKKISDDNVIPYVKENLDGDAYSERWLKPLLILIEYNRTDDSKLTWIDWDKHLQAEHILPDKWSANPDWKRQWTDDQAEQCLQKLGNLTLLSGKKNIVATNDSFRKKKVAYKKAHGGMTAFEISKEIAELDDWTELEFRRRHNQLKKEALKIIGI
jgi:uncharacterized protein with ParB-like and HNH nuclease domain